MLPPFRRHCLPAHLRPQCGGGVSIASDDAPVHMTRSDEMPHRDVSAKNVRVASSCCRGRQKLRRDRRTGQPDIWSFGRFEVPKLTPEQCRRKHTGQLRPDKCDNSVRRNAGKGIWKANGQNRDGWIGEGCRGRKPTGRRDVKTYRGHGGWCSSHPKIVNIVRTSQNLRQATDPNRCALVVGLNDPTTLVHPQVVMRAELRLR